jgi:hypothetical protein
MKHYRIKGTKALQASSCAKIVILAMQFDFHSKLEVPVFQLQRKLFSTYPDFKQ